MIKEEQEENTSRDLVRRWRSLRNRLLLECTQPVRICSSICSITHEHRDVVSSTCVFVGAHPSSCSIGLDSERIHWCLYWEWKNLSFPTQPSFYCQHDIQGLFLICRYNHQTENYCRHGSTSNPNPQSNRGKVSLKKSLEKEGKILGLSLCQNRSNERIHSYALDK